jgi:hypothetical protein
VPRKLLRHIMISLESYHQTYTYDTGNNLTSLSHQANSSAWQQTIAIHPNNNRGTETQQSASDFDLSLLLSLKMWVPMCRVLVCCFACLVEMSSEGR